MPTTSGFRLREQTKKTQAHRKQVLRSLEAPDTPPDIGPTLVYFEQNRHHRAMPAMPVSLMQALFMPISQEPGTTLKTGAY